MITIFEVISVHANFHGVGGCHEKKCHFQVTNSFQLGLTNMDGPFDFYLEVKSSKDTSNTMLLCVSPSLVDVMKLSPFLG